MESDLQLETALLGKLVRQNRSQHRSGKYFHALRQLHRRLRDFLSSNVLQLLQQIKEATPPALLAVAQSPELASQSKRLIFSLDYIQETTSLLIRAARLIAGLVILERFLPFCVTCFACLGRLHIILLQCQLHHVSAYNRLSATAARGKVSLPPTLPRQLHHAWQGPSLLISSRPIPSPGPSSNTNANTNSNSNSSSRKGKTVKSGVLANSADVPPFPEDACAPTTLAPEAAPPGTSGAGASGELQGADLRSKRLKSQGGVSQEGDSIKRERGPFGADGPSMAVLMQELGFGEFVSAPGSSAGTKEGYPGRGSGRERGRGRVTGHKEEEELGDGDDGGREGRSTRGGEEGEMGDEEEGEESGEGEKEGEEMSEGEGEEGEVEEDEGKEDDLEDGGMEKDGDEGGGAIAEETEADLCGREPEEEREEGEEEEGEEENEGREAVKETRPSSIGTGEKIAGIGAVVNRLEVGDRQAKPSNQAGVVPEAVSEPRPQSDADVSTGKLRGENVSNHQKSSISGKARKKKAAGVVGSGSDAKGRAEGRTRLGNRGCLNMQEKKGENSKKEMSILKDLLSL
ncbi:hypothetical protein CLOM_g12897 [Closterium sp. NIES-68]|nr:hypothetical protein CLOM_g12897 [Closterium sp. NIES-68]GJP83150.1 hypothetical protein CLOP_g13345 [Closterium sp. NIES-67]